MNDWTDAQAIDFSFFYQKYGWFDLSQISIEFMRENEQWKKS